MKSIHYRVLLILTIYLILKFIGGSFGRMALYPVTLLVTFLHEMGHALGAIISGGGVQGMQINPDGSGFTITRGGSQGLVLAGGYLGSSILGNVLFYIGAHKRQLTQTSLLFLATMMALAGIVWFQSIISTFLLLAFAFSLWWLAKNTAWDQDLLMFLGLAAVLYIIQDFDVGPSSDLAKYEQVVGIFKAATWKYVWLVFAGGLFLLNLRALIQKRS